MLDYILVNEKSINIHICMVWYAVKANEDREVKSRSFLTILLVQKIHLSCVFFSCAKQIE